MVGPDARVLSFHDVLLRRSDVELLKGQDWLNDQLISFYFTYILEEVYPGLVGRVCLMTPGTSFLLLNSDPSEAVVIFEALQLHGKDLVIFAVNDNSDVEHAAGGMHWSCLCYHRPSNTFRHYDSYAGATNKTVARHLAGAATPLVRSKSSSTTRHAICEPGFEQVSAMPSQQNGYDCGLYVCAVAEALCSIAAQQQAQHQQQKAQVDQQQQLSQPAGGGSCSDSHAQFAQQEREELQKISSGYITELRQKMLSAIENLAEQRQ